MPGSDGLGAWVANQTNVSALINPPEGTSSPLLASSVTRSLTADTLAPSTMLPAVEVSVTSPSPVAADPAVIGELTVMAVPAVSRTVPPVTPAPAIVRSSMSVKVTSLIPLLTESESISLAGLVSETVPAVAVTVSEVPVIGPVCVRDPPTASVIGPPTIDATLNPSLSVNAMAREPLTIERESTSLAVFVSVTSPPLLEAASDWPTMGCVCVKDPPT